MAESFIRGGSIHQPVDVFCFPAQVVQPLLECGADPRITNEQGEKPEHVAGKDLYDALRG